TGVDLGYIPDNGRTAGSLAQFRGVNGAGVLAGAFISFPVNGVDRVIEHEILVSRFLWQRGALIDRHLFVNVVEVAGIGFALGWNLRAADVRSELVGEKHARAEGVARNPIVIIQRVEVGRLAEIAQVIEALHGLSGGFGAAHRRQEQPGKNRDDRNHDQQLNQSESPSQRSRKYAVESRAGVPPAHQGNGFRWTEQSPADLSKK